MKNKLFRKIDEQRRLVIPPVFMEITGLKASDVIAFVAIGDDMISFVPFEESKDLPVIYKGIIGARNRIIIPKFLSDEVDEVEIFLYNGRITIR